MNEKLPQGVAPDHDIMVSSNEVLAWKPNESQITTLRWTQVLLTLVRVSLDKAKTMTLPLVYMIQNIVITICESEGVRNALNEIARYWLNIPLYFLFMFVWMLSNIRQALAKTPGLGIYATLPKYVAKSNDSVHLQTAVADDEYPAGAIYPFDLRHARFVDA